MLNAHTAVQVKENHQGCEGWQYTPQTDRKKIDHCPIHNSGTDDGSKSHI